MTYDETYQTDKSDELFARIMVTTVSIQNNRLWIYWCEVCTREFLSEAASLKHMHSKKCQKELG